MTHAQYNQVAYFLDKINRNTGAEKEDFKNRLKIYCFQKQIDLSKYGLSIPETTAAVQPEMTTPQVPEKSEMAIRPENRNCKNCGTPLIGRSDRAKFCNDVCRTTYNRQKRK